MPSLAPPFSVSAARLLASSTTPAGDETSLPTVYPESTFVAHDLDVSRLNALHHRLWYAGRARSSRPLHRQRMIRRDIVTTEQADLHMVWYESRFFVKPLPAYLLDYQFWVKNIQDPMVHASACGFLLSYTWLIRYPSDLILAQECNLIPWDIVWTQWVSFVRDILCGGHIDDTNFTNVNKRYEYGELRLGRLNTLYRLANITTMRALYNGYLPIYDQYSVFFDKKMCWAVVAFVYINTLLTAMQLCLTTTRLGHNQDMQNASVVFGVFAILLPVVAAGAMLVLFVLMYVANFLRAMRVDSTRSGLFRRRR
ncbi:hypothetical protein BDW62DRAFT_204550 [Aspergillus aurantiobrunneus]